MKLVFANNFYYLRGGSERVFFDEMELFESHGHEVAPFARRHEKNLPSKFTDFFAQEMELEGVPFFKKAAASFKLIYSWECRKKFGALLDYFRPDVVHGHNIYGRLTTSILDAARSKGVPAIITLHDYKLICPSYLMLCDGKVCERCLGGKFYNCLATGCHKGSRVSSLIFTAESYFNRIFRKYGHVSFFISPSIFLMTRLIEAGMPEERLAHVPNFIKTENFEPSYDAGDYILYAGRLSKEKGVLTMLRAVKGMKIQLKIVGDGPMRAEYERFVHENGLTNVVFEGYKTGEELRKIFKDSAFVVLPSEWYENAPMSVLEAFAYGKPVIGSCIGGIPELIRDGETGLLIKPGDFEELRDKISLLSGSSARIQSMGMKARKMVETEFNAETHYHKLMKIYQRVC